MLKVEKPEKVVWGSSKSFLALFLESLHKKKFFEPSCRKVRIRNNKQIPTGPLRGVTWASLFRILDRDTALEILNAER